MFIQQEILGLQAQETASQHLSLLPERNALRSQVFSFLGALGLTRSHSRAAVTETVTSLFTDMAGNVPFFHFYKYTLDV